MRLTENVRYILETLESAGYRADIVGGPVRDYLLGKEPSDYDITTSAHPDEVKRIFSSHKTVDTGIKHGTVTLVLDREPYEITTYRVDGEYRDARHPESVTFTARIEDDLARRDFTVNAMAYGLNGEICDPFGGREDLARRLIRAVGTPTERFSEDALRILRGIRFASVLEFEIDKDTAAAMRSLSYLLDKISAERIYTEWMKLLAGNGAYSVIRDYFDIIEVFIPELSGAKLPREDTFANASPLVRQLALFASVENSEDKYLSAMSRLKSPASVRDNGAAILAYLPKFSSKCNSDIGRMLNVLGETNSRELISLAILLDAADLTASEMLERYIKEGKPYKISDLKIGGNELMALGITGKNIGIALNELLFDVIDGRIENSVEALKKETVKPKKYN